MSRKKKKLTKKQRVLTPEAKAKLESIAQIIAVKVNVYYLALIADVAFSLQDELFERYIGGKTYNNNYRLKMILDGYKKVADDHYEWFSSLVTDKQFYADLRDGANEYIMPIIRQLNKAYNQAYRDAGCSRNAMAALVACIVCVAKSVNDTEKWLRDMIKLLTSCRLEKTEKYEMRFELNYSTWILDTYGKPYSDVHKDNINVIMGKLVEALMPEQLLRNAVGYAKQYQPAEKIETFKKDMSSIFNINW